MSAVKYHINQETQRPNICRAAPGKCPVGGNHFNNKEDARTFVEKTNAATYGTSQKSLKKAGSNKGDSTTPHKDAYSKARAKANKVNQAIEKTEREIKKAKIDMLENGAGGMKRTNLSILKNNLKVSQNELAKLEGRMDDLKEAAEQEAREVNIDDFTSTYDGRSRLEWVNKKIRAAEKTMSDIEAGVSGDHRNRHDDPSVKAGEASVGAGRQSGRLNSTGHDEDRQKPVKATKEVPT